MIIVWFKRDLRVDDHTALLLASRRGPILPLYIIEPKLWKQPDLGHRHYGFLVDCLNDLRLNLRALGQTLTIKVGDALEVFSSINAKSRIKEIWSHQETWNGWTYTRDKTIKKWANCNSINWQEPTHNGVVRNLKSRNGWSAQWYKKMRQPIDELNFMLPSVVEDSDSVPTATALGIPEDYCSRRQNGGRTEALKLLNTFLYERGEDYTKGMSSPVTAFDSCSRLSPHLAFGTISIRELLYSTESRANEVKSMKIDERGKWPSALRSFGGRLRWHCHFVQKLEDEPRIEFENMHPLYNGLRENDFNDDFFSAWKLGRTGFPMIDACMRALITTGWINFRMRAMLMSFASYHLWLHWRKPALHLAQLFTDYEPGIHYSQTQMQSGTTGINSIRIYNPIKQGRDQDPKGAFIREWVPELRSHPAETMHTPWTCPAKLGDYPAPIVEEKFARKTAADKIYALRKVGRHKQVARGIVERHGSRKSGLISSKKIYKMKSKKQGSFDL